MTGAANAATEGRAISPRELTPMMKKGGRAPSPSWHGTVSGLQRRSPTARSHSKGQLTSVRQGAHILT
eukprot:2705445-Alexandrium_andersonii.AAC.1